MLNEYLNDFYLESSMEEEDVISDSDEDSISDSGSKDKNIEKAEEVVPSEDKNSENSNQTSTDAVNHEDLEKKSVSNSSDSTAVVSDQGIINDELASDDFILPFLIGKKLGMTQLFSESGTSFPVTVIEAGPCTVLQIKCNKNDGYNSVQLGYSDKKESKTNKPLMGHFNKSKSTPKSFLKEFRSLNAVENLSLGDIVTVNQFNEGDYITVTGISKGKGFAGHMKRHGFSGGRASHGKNSVMRKAGSVGAGTSPGRIFPGMKMAGRMGNEKVSIKNLSIVNIDKIKNLIFLTGAVPGANNNIVYLSKS